jgi:hypothetical protein
MKKVSLFLFSLLISTISLAYGPIAHRAIAIVAQNELRPKVKKQLDALLGTNGMIYHSTWADEIRDLPQYAESSPGIIRTCRPTKHRRCLLSFGIILKRKDSICFMPFS